MKAFTVESRMIPSKVAYTLYGGILGLHMPFLNIFFMAVGLTASQAGFISGIRFASAAVAGPMWGMLADYTGRRKIIMAAISLGSAFPIFAMPWIAKTIHPNVNYTCTNVTSSFGITHEACEAKMHKEITTLFYVFLAITVFGSIFVMSMPGYVDSIVILVVKSGVKNTSYGAQRIFGSIGFTAANFIGGFVADHYNHPGITHYTGVFLMYLPSCLLLIPVGCYLVGQANWETKKEGEEPEKATHSKKEIVTWENSITRKVFLLIKRFDVSFFATTVFISGLANSLFLSFSFILVRQYMHVSKTKMTFVVATGSMSELLIFPISSFIIKKIGTAPCITLGIFSYFIRFLTMSYANEFWMVVVLQLLHGIGFALSWAAMMEHTHQLVSKEISGTVFNIMCAVFYSFSALVANMIGGVLYDEVGGKELFRYVSGVCGIWTIFMSLYYGAIFFRNKHPHKFDKTVRYKSSQEENVKNKGVVSFDSGFANPLGVMEDESPEVRLETM